MKGWHGGSIDISDPLQLQPLRVLWDTLVANHEITGGKMMPIIQVDTTNRLDVKDLVRVHAMYGTGEVTSHWASPHGRDDVIWLVLRFRPSGTVAILEFDRHRHGGLLDLVVRFGGLRLIPAEPDAQYRGPDVFTAPGFNVEVPSDDFAPEWDRLWTETIMKTNGVTRDQAEEVKRVCRDLTKGFE